jgi:hypothetical protein
MPGYDVLHGASLKAIRECCAPDTYGRFLQALRGKLNRYFGPDGPDGSWSAGVPSGTVPAAAVVAPTNGKASPRHRVMAHGPV